MDGRLVVMFLVLLLTGCINISTRFQPEDLSVKEELEGSDCVPYIFGIGFGTADLELAKRDAKKIVRAIPKKGPQTIVAPQHITKVRRVEITDLVFFIGGAKCIDVVGEP